MSINLGEGGTPLIRSRRIGPSAGLTELYFKLESLNPTGSYKDRFAATAIANMVADGQKTCIATSSGNTGSSLAAYCGAAGIHCRIAIVETAPEAKLLQMRAYGADIFRVKGFGIDPEITSRTIAALRSLAERPGHALQISAFAHCPAAMEAVQGIAHEIRLEGDFDHVFCPAGGGGLALAVARGFANSDTSVHVVQPEGNNTIAGPLREGLDRAQNADCTTRISGLQVASVIDGHDVIRACRSTGGTGYLVTDEDVFEAQSSLARKEGVFSEPAGAVALAGALKALQEGEIDSLSRIVCLVTGTGFKDTNSLTHLSQDPCPLIALSELESQIQR